MTDTVEINNQDEVYHTRIPNKTFRTIPLLYVPKLVEIRKTGSMKLGAFKPSYHVLGQSQTPCATGWVAWVYSTDWHETVVTFCYWINYWYPAIIPGCWLYSALAIIERFTTPTLWTSLNVEGIKVVWEKKTFLVVTRKLTFWHSDSVCTWLFAHM